MSLHQLAEAAGLAPGWKDVHNQWHHVGDDTLRLALAALGLPAATDAEVADTLQQVRSPTALPPLFTGEANGVLHLPVPGGAYTLTRGGAAAIGGTAEDHGGAAIPLPAEPGYYTLSIRDVSVTVAVAPPRGWTVADAVGGTALGTGRPALLLAPPW